MKSTLKRALLLGALCGLSVSSTYSMEMVRKAVNAVSKAFSSGPDFTDLIVSDDLMKHMKQCAVELKAKVDGEEVLPNMLVAGPRACKTKFVNNLANYSGIGDFWHIDLNPEIVRQLSADTFQRIVFSPKKAVEGLKKIFEFIESSEKPSLLMIDYAHLLGVGCEDVPEEARDCYRAISRLLLEYLDKPSKKCVIVAVIDHPRAVDGAVLMRLDDYIVFGKAEDAVKLRLFGHYLNKPLQETETAFTVEEGALSEEVRKRILAQFPVWTESGMYRFVMRLANAARMSEDKVLTPAMVKKVIDWEKEERKSGRIIW